MTFFAHRGRAKILAEHIVRKEGQQCPFKYPVRVSEYWVVGIDSFHDVYMASQTAVGNHYLKTQGKGNHHLTLPKFKHFLLVHTGGVAADKAKDICRSELRKIIAEESARMRRSSTPCQPALA